MAWSRQVSDASTEEVAGLLLWGERPVVNLVSTTCVFAPDGARLWERARMPGSPVAVGNGNLYLENENCKLDAVTPANELVLDNVPFPVAMNSGFRVQLIWPMAEVWLAVAFWPGREPDQRPDIPWARTVYGHRIGDEGGNIREWMWVPPLYVPELDRLYICADSITCIETAVRNSQTVFPKPFEEPVEWSADRSGGVCIAGYDEERKALVRLGPDGAEVWRWVDTEGDDRWTTGQPPIDAGQGRVLALAGRRLLALENGSLLWQYQNEAAPLSRGTTLADGSVLVTAGNTLHHVSSTGSELLRVPVEGEIATSPVVDADGRIYVATESNLVRID